MTRFSGALAISFGWLLFKAGPTIAQYEQVLDPAEGKCFPFGSRDIRFRNKIAECSGYLLIAASGSR